MDYKKLFKSRRSRVIVLNALRIIPDKPMIKLQYWIKMDQKLNLDSPQLFTEKMQWYKLYYRNNLLKRCTDKANVREYIDSIGLSDILIPLIGIYESPNEVPFDSLPDGLVFKDTLGGGGGSVLFSDAMKETDVVDIKKKMQQWVDSDRTYKANGREWQYGGVHRIIIEKRLYDQSIQAGLLDYKIHCFNGKPVFVQCIGGRNLTNHTGYQNNYDFEWNKLDWTFADYPDFPYDIPKPQLLDNMYEVARIISKKFPYVRVDLYCVDNKIYFGEMTFNAGSGYYPYKDRWTKEKDLELGRMLTLPDKIIVDK